MPSRDPTVLMIGTSMNPDLLRTPHEMGLRLVLVAPSPPPDPSMCDRLLRVDPYDTQAVVDAARRYTTEGSTINAVACFHEGLLATAAAVAEALGVPGNSPATVASVRDKQRASEVLSAHGVATPRSVLVASRPDAAAATERVGLPAVVKPQSGSSSQGVVLVHTPEEAADAYDMVASLYDRPDFRAGSHTAMNVAHAYFDRANRGVVVQEFIDGPEFAVDAVYGDDEIAVLGIHEKPSGWDERWFIERTYLTPPRLEQVDRDAIADVVCRALLAVGATAGGAHVEVRLTTAGPVVIEINARLGGTTALVQESIRASTGVWGPEEYLKAVLGGRPGNAEPTRCAGFTALLADKTGRIVGFTGVDEALAIPGVERIRWMASVGTDIVIDYPANPVSCFALVMATGQSPEEVLTALDRAEAVLHAEQTYCP